MAGSQQMAGYRAGSAFTIKNILNLPEDSNKSQFQPTTLGSDITAPLIPQPIDVSAFPPHASRNGSWPCGHWTVSFISQPYPRRSRGRIDFARERRPILVDNHNWLELRRRGLLSLKKKQRSLFSPKQVQRMEKKFASMKYLTENKRAELAVELKLTDTQVKTWFQNRRTKWRKELRNENPPREVPDGRLKYTLKARKRT